MSIFILKAANRAVLLPLAVAAFVILSGCAEHQPLINTEEFSLEVNTYSEAWRPAQSLVVDKDGNARYMFIPPGIDQKPFTKRFQLSPRQLRKIQRKIEKIGFFELEKEYADRRFQGGWNCEVTVKAGDRSHKVHVVNREVPPIIKLLETINSVTPLPNSMKFLQYVIF